MAGGGTTGSGGSGTGGSTVPEPQVVTSASATWKEATLTEVPSGNADVTVNDTTAQTWDGFGGTFNEMGWNLLTTPVLQQEAMNLLFGQDGCRFNLGRIPIGASDYAMSRYTYDDTGTDVTPDSTESNRPPADLSLTKFSIDRDKEKLIPFIKAAMAVRSDIRFWASPWTPPVWMKAKYNTKDGSDSSKPAKRPSYFDGGSMKSDEATLKAYAQYFVKFVQAYKEQGINVEAVAPQNEPNFEQNYPSCLWDKATYTSFVKLLAPAIKDASLTTKIMLGTMSNFTTGDQDIVSTVMGDSTAKSLVSSIGLQWSMVDKAKDYKTYNLPMWVSEHKCGNYPWNPSGSPKYVEPAPNDYAYAKESWGLIRDAIKGGITAYNAWNMVLDKMGKGNDTSRAWAQNSLLVVDGGKITQTPVYYVFRHFSQFVEPGATVLGTSSADAYAFKNSDGTIVTVLFNSGSAKTNFTVSAGGKKMQFSMPAGGWATVNYKP
jgi:glucosylceramidase